MKTLDMEFIQTEATLKNLIYLFARSIDRVDEELMRELFWPEATDDHGLFTGTAEDYVAWVIPLLKSMNGTQHTISNILVEVEGDKASAETYFVAYHQIGEGDEAIDMIAAGRYFDKFEKRGDEWKFSHRKAVYDWNRNDPASENWSSPEMKPLLERGARKPDDYLYKN